MIFKLQFYWHIFLEITPMATIVLSDLSLLGMKLTCWQAQRTTIAINFGIYATVVLMTYSVYLGFSLSRNLWSMTIRATRDKTQWDYYIHIDLLLHFGQNKTINSETCLIKSIKLRSKFVYEKTIYVPLDQPKSTHYKIVIFHTSWQWMNVLWTMVGV